MASKKIRLKECVEGIRRDDGKGIELEGERMSGEECITD